MIKAIIFDVGGVLSVNKPSNKNRNHSGVHEYVAKKFGKDLDSWFDSIDSVYAGSITGEVSREEFIKTASENIGVSGNRIVKTVREAYKNRLKKNLRIYRLIKKLKKEGYALGVLSDQWALSGENLITSKDRKMFDIVILSNEAGIRKPNPGIYRLMMKKLKRVRKGIKYKEVLFVDNRQWNLTPAKKLGMVPILFKNNEQFLKNLKNKL